MSNQMEIKSKSCFTGKYFNSILNNFKIILIYFKFKLLNYVQNPTPTMNMQLMIKEKILNQLSNKTQ